jgi:hypothetical protein
MLLPIHIAAGGLAVVLGAVALSVKKGGTTHRRIGLLFVCALPIVLLFGAMFYWLWRVRSRRTLPVLVRHDSMPLVTRAS